MHRRHFLTVAGIVPIVSAFPRLAGAQARKFAPALGPWRTFEIVTRVELIGSGSDTQAWIPVPAVNSDWQQSLDSTWKGNAAAVSLHTPSSSDARMVHARWSSEQAAPDLEVVSTVKT